MMIQINANRALSTLHNPQSLQALVSTIVLRDADTFVLRDADTFVLRDADTFLVSYEP
jgi:hypothetical protein